MAGEFRPSSLALLSVPNYDLAPHIAAMEDDFCRLVRGDFTRLLVSIPIRHGKSEYANNFISWLLITNPRRRILRVMAAAKTAEMEAVHVLRCVEKYGWKFNPSARISQRKSSVSHFQLEPGGELRSIGAEGDVESWTFDWIVIDDLITDPYEIRNPNRRQQIYNDLNTKFFSRVNPVGDTRFVFIGSRRHPDDPQGRLLESNRNLPPRKRWRYHARPAILDEGTDHESALWPAAKEFDLPGLRAIREQKIADGVGWEWSCNFQNDPIGSADMLAFDPKWFDESEIFYDCPVEALPAAKHTLITVDPSMGPGSELNDYFAALYLRFTHDGSIFVDDSFIEQASPDRAVENVVALIARRQDVSIIPFESNAGGLYVGKCIRDECERRGLRCPIVYKSWSTGGDALDNSDKVGRITTALWEKLSRKKIKLRDMPYNRILYRQLRGFPTEKMDGPDALATGDIVLRQLLTKGR